MFNEKLKNKLRETEEELRWWHGYAGNIESAIKEMRDLIDESEGVAGYHLNGDIATWSELIDDSLFSFAEDNMKDRKEHDGFCSGIEGIRNLKIKDEFYVKEYTNMPWQIHFNPSYGGIKYIKEREND